MVGEETKSDNTHEESEKTLYELGFLLVPTVPEDKLPEEVVAIEEIIKSGGGAARPREQEAPKSVSLAYGMEKRIKGKKHIFGTAFFGSLIFDAPAGDVGSVESGLEKNASVLRFLIVKRTEASLTARTVPEPRESVAAPAGKTRKTYQKKTKEERGKMDEGQVDSAIAELIEE